MYVVLEYSGIGWVNSVGQFRESIVVRKEKGEAPIPEQQ